MNEQDAQDIAKLKQGQNAQVREIYHRYRSGFLMFIARYIENENDRIDIYQDAFVTICEYAGRGKLDSLQSSLKTYLYAIGKYMAFSRLKKNKSEATFEYLDDNQDLLDKDLIQELEEDYSEQEKTILLSKLIDQMGEQCRRILRLFYYEGKKAEEIAKIMGYTNKDVLKSQKSRCMKQLKDLANRK